MGKKKNKKSNVTNEDLKKDVVTDPNVLKQELEVLIKNLNRERNLQDGFILKDDEVSDVDDAELSDDGDDEVKEEEEIKKAEPLKDDKPEKVEETTKKSKKEKKEKKKLKEASEVKEEPMEVEEPIEVDKKKKKKKKKKSKDEKDPDNAQEEQREPKRKNVENVQADYGFLKDTSTHNRPQCLVKSALSGDKWYNVLSYEIEDEDIEENEYWVSKIEAYGQKLLDNETTNYTKSNKNDTEKQWLNTVLKSGTLTDKISAYTVHLQESPVQNLSSLDQLIGMISLKSRRPCMLSLDALIELYKTHLLPNDRKLRYFKEQPLKKLSEFSNNKDIRDKYLILWSFESKLKEAFKTFLQNLQEVSKDSIEKTRMKVMSVILELLINSPEQEQDLLGRLVNKLGDPTRSVAAKAIHQLSKLLEAHPAMTPVVMEEIEHLLYRPNVNPKAQYYGICCLTQLLLDGTKPEMANRLIKIYFSFFKASVKKGEVDTKMVSALLTGVNRAYPFAKVSHEGMEEHKESLYKIIHVSSNFNVAMHALMLLYQVQGEAEAEDRFYSTFYRKLLDSGLSTMNKQAQLFNLVFKVLKNDPNVPRMIAITKRLLQVALYQQPHLICAVLYLLSELMKNRGKEANLLAQVLESTSKKSALFQEDSDMDDDDDDFKADIDTSDDEGNKPSVEPSASTSSWVHKKVHKPQNHKSETKEFYDTEQRNPAYAGADKTNHWELALLSKHFHPSVNLFANTIMEGSDIKYNGDPLQDFTTMRFLDRFVFRNPKKTDLAKQGTSVFNKRNQYRAKGIKSLAPDSKEYLSKDLEQIPIDERFIYKYLKDKRSKDTEEAESDAESVNSEEFNEVMKDSMEDPVDLDFAGNIDDNEIEKDSDDEEESELEDGEDDSDLELQSLDSLDDASDTEELEKEDFDDDNEEENFQDEEDEFEPPPKKKAKKPKFKTNDLHSLLASADEFASMIDENAGEDTTGTLGAIFNKDKSHAKQMKWESKRLNQKRRK